MNISRLASCIGYISPEIGFEVFRVIIKHQQVTIDPPNVCRIAVNTIRNGQAIRIPAGKSTLLHIQEDFIFHNPVPITIHQYMGTFDKSQIAGQHAHTRSLTYVKPQCAGLQHPNITGNNIIPHQLQ